MSAPTYPASTTPCGHIAGVRDSLTMRRVVLAAAAAGLAAARPSAPSPARASNHTIPASRSAACEGGGLGAGEHEIAIEVQAANGEVQQRLFYVHVPEDMPAGQEMPSAPNPHNPRPPNPLP